MAPGAGWLQDAVRPSSCSCPSGTPCSGMAPGLVNGTCPQLQLLTACRSSRRTRLQYQCTQRYPAVRPAPRSASRGVESESESELYRGPALISHQRPWSLSGTINIRTDRYAKSRSTRVSMVSIPFIFASIFTRR